MANTVLQQKNHKIYSLPREAGKKSDSVSAYNVNRLRKSLSIDGDFL